MWVQELLVRISSMKMEKLLMLGHVHHSGENVSISVNMTQLLQVQH